MRLDEFIAEIETTFKNYVETGDIDRISIKTWVIEGLREMGKNICEKNEMFLNIEKSRALLPENFKSLILALNLTEMDECDLPKNNTHIYKRIIEDPGYYDWVTGEFVYNCNSRIITEQIIYPLENRKAYYQPTYLSLIKGFNRGSFDVDCVNMHPSIRNAYKDQINITNRTINANFKSGRIYIQYNSLPTDEDGEILIPEYTTGEIVKYIQNNVKINIAQDLIIGNKNPTGLRELLPLWLQERVRLRNGAKSEASFNNVSDNWSKIQKAKNQAIINKFDLRR